MNRHSTVRDMTGLQPTGGGGMDMRKNWLCGHPALTGVRKKVAGRVLLWMCTACAKKAEGK